MRPFQLHHPGSLEEVHALLAQHGSDDTHLIAGGTSLMVLMTLGLIEPARLIALRNVLELKGIQPQENGGLEIKAMATHRELEVSRAINEFCPALAETFGHVATIRIRNQGTIGGNL